MHYPSATQPNWCRGRRRVRRDRRARLRCRLRPVGRANTGSQGQHQINFAHNFPRSLFETTRKRCNSNELISMFKQVARELRAKLLRRRQGPRQTNFACNSIRPNFNKPRKRCNSNDANSMFEQAAGELHAKLMSDSHNWAGLVWFCGPGVLRVVGCYWWCCAHWRAYWLGESQSSALWGCSSL